MTRFLLLSLLAAASTSLWAGTSLPLKNPGFEDGLDGWILLEDKLPQKMSVVLPEAAREGDAGLRVDDQDTQLGSSLVSQPLPAQPGRTYKVTFHARAGSGKGGVYLRFYDAGKKVINPDKLPSANIGKQGDWEQFSVEAVAPEGTTALGVWVHSWSGAKGIIDFDDFSVEESEGISAAPPAIPRASAEVPATGKVEARREGPAKIVIKADDLKASQGGRLHPAWDRFADMIKQRKIKASIGVICNSLEGNSPVYFQWIKDLQASGLVEFWFHAYDHGVRSENGQDYAEFVHRPYEEQKERFEKSEKLAAEKLGLTFQTFGPPGGGKAGSFDEQTVRVMADVPAMKIWLYPQPLDEKGRQLQDAGKVTILDRVWQVNIEQPLFKPNYQKFVEGYSRFPNRPYFVIQGHPAHWDDAGFAEFGKILDFLVAEGAEFVTPAECARTVAASTNQTAQAH